MVLKCTSLCSVLAITMDTDCTSAECDDEHYTDNLTSEVRTILQNILISCVSRFKTSCKQKVSVYVLDFKVLSQYQPINDGSGKFDTKKIVNNANIFVCYLFLENIITALHKRMQSTKV